VQFTAPYREERIANRQLGTVERMDSGGNLQIQLDSGRGVQFNIREHPHLDYGYPTTVARIGLRLVLKELGFPEVSWHCFRRTLATLLSEQGAQVKIAQEQLGHASARTTLEFYVQAMPGSRRQAIEQIGRILDPNGPKFRRSLDKGVSLIQ
jgi:integrase